MDEAVPPSEKLYVELLTVLLADCCRDSDESARDGVVVPVISPCSAAPAHARNTASRIGGVKRDRVRWESVRVARRNKFLCEKVACVSDGLSMERDATSASSKGRPNASQALIGGEASGSMGCSLLFAA